MRKHRSKVLLSLIFAIFVGCGSDVDTNPSMELTENTSALSFCTVDQDEDGFNPDTGDCNDNNSAIHPDAIEVCDLVDNNCDQQIDEGFDQDGDGFSVCAEPLPDCDDTNADIGPGAIEVCNNVDDNCDTVVDEGFDVDGDGFTTCSEPTADCDDENSAINPNAVEVCDNVDNNCDSAIDEGFDQDSDGFTPCALPFADCNDLDAEINPGAVEVCNNVDDNCKGTIDEGFDADGDGFTTCSLPVADCDDTNAAVFPGAHEFCNLIDDDCDGLIDEGFDLDGDGFSVCALPIADCDDNNAAVYPGASEVCNNIDDNCDGAIDENVTQLCGVSDVGLCEYGVQNCAVGVWDDCVGNIDPTPEVCDIEDNDCDGEVDEDFDADDDGDGYTICNDCDDTDSNIHPEAIELCDGIDNDCNALVDDNCVIDGVDNDQDNDGWTPEAGDCDDTNAIVHPNAIEIGNELDDDCDGEVDEQGAKVQKAKSMMVSYENGVVTLSGSEATTWIGAYFWTWPGEKDSDGNYFMIQYVAGQAGVDTMTYVAPNPSEYVFFNFASNVGNWMYLDPSDDDLTLNALVAYHCEEGAGCALELSK